MSSLKQLMTAHGVSQTDLARLLNRDKSVITNLFQGKRQLKADEASIIADHLGVPVARVLGKAEPAAGFSEPVPLIPFQHEPKQNKNRAGVVRRDGKFFLQMEDGGGSVGISKAFALEVRDDSMNLAGIMEGDIIVSELDKPCKAGDMVIVQHYVKQGAETLIRSYEPPLLLPRSTSAAFKPIPAKDESVRLVSPLIKLIRLF